MSLKLTLLIPCKNEAHNLRGCIESARHIVDEVLVADSGSEDGTVELARQLGARVIERAYGHAGDFKNWAIPQASHEWVLLLDADERLTAELADEIVRCLEDGPTRDGYWIYRNTFFLGKPLRHSGCNTDKVLRLFHRDRARYEGETDHAEIRMSAERAGVLEHRMEHYSYRSLDDYFRKFHRYTKQKAEVKLRQGVRVSFAKMLLTVPFRFAYLYGVRRGFLDGIPGLLFCMYSAVSSLTYQAHLWEAQMSRASMRERSPDRSKTTEDGGCDRHSRAA